MNPRHPRHAILITLLAASFLSVGLGNTGAAERQVVPGQVPAAVKNLRALGPLPEQQRLELAIGLPLRDAQGLSNLLAQIYDPLHPNYRRYLTAEQFAERFGPTQKDYDALIAFAKAHGLAITGTHPNRTLLDVGGPVADIEKALHVNMRVYQHPTETRTFHAPDVEPSLDLDVKVLGISGLDDFEPPHPMGLEVRPYDQSGGTPYATGSGPRASFIGKDFRAAYAPGVALDGAGQSLGLFQLDGYYPNDIAAYISQAGLPNVPISNVLVSGFSGAPGANNVEVALDIDMAISMAPGLDRVVVYEGRIGNDILNRMATDNLCRQLSSSWGYGPRVDPVRQQIFMQFAAQGQSMFQASGDLGAWVGQITAPSDDPFLTVVGGTILTTTSPGGSWQSETTWPESGGGFSNTNALPDYQKGISMTANQGSLTKRNIPDVAAHSDGSIWIVANNGEFLIVGGTSAATPLWAGFAALVNQQAAASGKPPIGFANPALYSIGKELGYPSAFHDITTGNNTNSSSANKFQAVPGFDLCTGWGTPTGSNLIAALLAPPNPLRITPATGVTFSGPTAGPFNPGAESYTLTNVGTLAINWSLVSTSAWLSVTPTAGSVSPGGPAINVSVALTTAASNLAAGIYSTTVVFTNLNDLSVQSRAFALAVVTPPAITAQPASQVVFEGATATFSVGVSNNALLFFQWRQDNGSYLTNLSDGGNISGSSSSTLVISNVNSANVGACSVVITNAAGAVISSNAFLTLLPWRPVIATQPTDQTAFPGETITFQVGAVGTQPLSYRWRKNGANLLDGGNISGVTTSGLTLGNISAADAAGYSVVVTNSLGAVTSAVAVLTVNSLTVPGITLSRLYAFTGGADGGRPNGLTQARDGDFYATTQNGGVNDDGAGFRLSASGLFSPLCSFNLNDTNGATPYSPLLQWGDGNLYGTAFRGGAFDNGSVFKLTTNGSLTGLISLNITNGDFPYAGVTMAPDGNAYGTTYKGGGAGAGTVFRLTTNGAVATIYSFSGGTDGNFPYAGLTLGPDGNLFGTTYKGGANGVGAVFRITTNGIALPLASFNNTNGSFPYSGLTLGSDGNFYGTASSGGSFGNGTIFKASPTGSLTNLYSFTGGIDGGNPVASLLAANDGNFYGTTANGGTYGDGTVFRLAPDGTFATLAQFDEVLGANPITPMIQATNGNLYGTTQNGGPEGQGTVFQVGTTGAVQITSQPASQLVYGGATVLLSVAVSGSHPFTYRWKLQGTNLADGGNVFGSTNRVLTLTNVTPANAGIYSVGITNPLGGLQSADGTLSVTMSPPVLTLQPTNQTVTPGVTVLFAASAVGNLPLSYQWQTNGGGNLNDGGQISGARSSTLTISGVTEANNAIYSVLVSNALGQASSTGAVLTVIPPSAPGTRVTALHWFSSGGLDGDTPNGLARGLDGTLYGTTQFGGTNHIFGTVFSLTTNGTLTTLASFAGNTNPSSPRAAVMQAPDGLLYGTTSNGGVDGVGTVFRLSTNGILTTLCSFDGNSNSINPYTALVQGADSNFYGSAVNPWTTYATIFKVTAAGTLTDFYTFMGGTDGTLPAGALLPLTGGNFYGLSSGGGASGSGDVFRLSANGTLATLYSFTGGSDGYSPAGALIQATDGNLYGVTTRNVFGGFQFYGTMFRVTTNGAFSTIYTLNAGEGIWPAAGLIQASDGNLYGTTEFGGATGNGTVFRITPGGSFAKLVNLDGIDLGGHPRAALVEGPDGALCGTCNSGGPGGKGTVFKLSFTDAPQITSQPANVALLPGGNASFNVTVFGAPPLFYRWQKNGTNLTDTGKTSGSATRILTVTNVGSAEAGTYSVIVSNSFGFVPSSGAALTIIPVPAFQSFTKTNTNFRFTWSSAAGQKYQVQYRSNLVLGNWSNLGNVINATGSLATASDPISTNRQRFYRVYLLP